MRFRRKAIQRMNYRTTNFLVTYFIVGILALLLLSVTYVSYVVESLNQSQVEQVKPLADLAALIPSVNEKSLHDDLNTIFRQLWENSRLSFILENKEDGSVVKVRGVDPVLDHKLDTREPLTSQEAKKLAEALAHMKRTALSHEDGGKIQDVSYLEEGRELLGYLYYGDVSPERMGSLPFVIADFEGKLVAWRLWKDLIKIENANEVEIAQAEALRRQAAMERRVVPLQLSPPADTGNLYYEVAKHYELMLMPYVQMLLIAAFLSIGIVFYRNSKQQEQAAIWGGLARETAHQLGTPISALMGWVEVIGEQASEQETASLQYICEQMQGDIARLQKINARFGKIGTEPERALVDIGEVIQDVVAYFEKRIPSKSRQVEIILPTVNAPPVMANRELIQWVFENLIKNSLDAMDKPQSRIEFAIHVFPKRKHILIVYSDNGRGIPWNARKKIFLPGHTTKKHGWGLGLTLAQRIVQEYHHGKIRLANSSPEKTTFEICLPIATSSRGIVKDKSVAV